MKKTLIPLMVASLALSGLFALGRAGAQTTTTLAPGTPQNITLIVNVPGATASAATGFQVDVACTGLFGVSAGGSLSQSFIFPVTGGVNTATFNMQTGTDCVFRMIALGTGPRSLFGNSIIVGGFIRNVTYLSTVNGVPVDPNTAFQTDPIPVEAATQAIFGQLPPPTTTTVATTTTLAPTTLATTTTVAPTTTRPPTTTAPPPTAPPATAPPAAPPPTIVRTVPVVTTKAKPRVRTRVVCTRSKSGRRTCRTVRVSSH